MATIPVVQPAGKTPAQIAQEQSIKDQISKAQGQIKDAGNLGYGTNDNLNMDATGKVLAKTAPTLKDLGLSAPRNSYQTSTDAAQAALEQPYLAGVPDQTKTFQDTLAQFQAQIDALTAASAQKKAELTRKYDRMDKENMGMTGAIQARRGLLGSDFGEQQQQTVSKSDADAKQAALDLEEANYQASYQSLMTGVRTQANDTYQKKLDAYNKSASDLIANNKSKESQRQSDIATAAQKALALGIDLSDPKNKSILDEMGNSDTGIYGGASGDEIIKAYKDAKATADSAKTKAEQDQADLKYKQTQTQSEEATIAKTKAETARLYNDAKTAPEKAFYSDISTTQNDLSSGKKTWGQAFELIKGKYPWAADTTIDSLLNKDIWGVKGAYEARKKAESANSTSQALIDALNHNTSANGG